MKNKKIIAIVMGASIIGGLYLYKPVVAHAESVNHKATVVTKTKDSKSIEKYTIANSGLQLQAVDLKTGKIIPTTKKEEALAKKSFAVTFHGYEHATRYNGYHLHQLKNQAYFHSALQERLYNYLLNPNNRWAVEKEAIALHGGDREDDCSYFVSTALNWLGAGIPYTSYCGTLRDELANNGWVEMTDVSQLEAGDVCFAGDSHTYIFMGWANQGESIAWIADSQYGWFGNNVHVRSTWQDGDIFKTTDFWGAPGADVYNPNVNEYGNANPGYKSYNVGVTNSYVDVYSGAGYGYSVIGSFPSGDTIQILESVGSWFKVNYNGSVGYVPMSSVNGNGPVHPNNITIPYTSQQYPEIATGTINSYTYAMPNANWNGNEVTTFNSGQAVVITGYSSGSGQNGGWYRVDYQDGSLWVPAVVVNTSIRGEQYPKAATGIINNLNDTGTWVLGEINNWNTHIGNLSNGTNVVITGEKDGWYRVDYMQTSGWIPKDRIDNPSAYKVEPLNQRGVINFQGGYTDTKDIPSWNGYDTYALNNGTQVNVIGEWKDWYKINVNGNIQWVMKDRVNVYTVLGAGMLEFPSYGGSCITNGPSWSSGVQTLLPDNTILNVIGEKDGWFKVLLSNGSEGWLPRTRFVTNLNDSMMLGVGTSNIESNLRTAPNFQGTVVGTLPSGSYVNIKAQKDGWYEIYYGNNGATAWIEGNRMDTSLNSNMKVIKTGIIDFNGGSYTSLAYGPSWQSDFAGTLNNGTKVEIVGESGSWYRINFGNSTAWILKNRVQNYKVLGAGMLEFPSYGGSCITNGPSWSSGVMTLLPDNTILNVIGEKDGWFEVTIPGGGIGWLPKTRFVTNLNDSIMLGVGTSNVASDLQEGPNWTSNTIALLPANSYINIKSEKDGWYEIYYGDNGATAWIEGNRLDTQLNQNMKVIKIGTIDFNGGQFTSLAYGPSWNCDFAGTLDNGTKVQIVGESGAWYRINLGNSTAWVLKNRIKTN